MVPIFSTSWTHWDFTEVEAERTESLSLQINRLAVKETDMSARLEWETACPDEHPWAQQDPSAPANPHAGCCRICAGLRHTKMVYFLGDGDTCGVREKATAPPLTVDTLQILITECSVWQEIWELIRTQGSQCGSYLISCLVSMLTVHFCIDSYLKSLATKRTVKYVLC